LQATGPKSMPPKGGDHGLVNGHCNLLATHIGEGGAGVANLGQAPLFALSQNA
jgi:hypothetical protein